MAEMPTLEQILTYAALGPRGTTRDTRSWRLVLDGREIDFNHILLVLDDPTNPHKPALAVELGLIDDGRYQYDGVRVVELGGGGVALVPFVILKGELWIGTIRQYRFLLGQEELGLPRGYKPRGVPANEHVLAEAVEEFGRSVLAGGEVFPLVGVPVNPASHVLDTRPLPTEPNPGGYMFGVPLSPEMVTWPDAEGPQIIAQAFAPTDKLESLTRGELLPWWDAVQCRDGVLAIGTARLMATLHLRQQLETTFRNK